MVLSQILTTQGKVEAWETCCEVLSKLNEIVPDSVDLQTVGKMVRQTGETLSKISDEDLLNMKEIDSTTRSYVLKFYQHLVCLPCLLNPFDMSFR